MDSEILCDDCLDTGWLEDREGRCACISESVTEPYQILQLELDQLRQQVKELEAELNHQTLMLEEERASRLLLEDRIIDLEADDFNAEQMT